MLPLLVPLAIQILPQIGKWLFGDTAAATIKDVGNVVSAVTGVADPHTPDGMASVEAVLQGKPELAGQIQAQLAQIAATREAEANRATEAQRAAELASLQASIADTDSARKQTVALAAAGSKIAYGAPLVSFIVLLTFAGAFYFVLTRELPQASQPIVIGFVEVMKALSVAVVSYWVGSSAGSARKDGTISQQSQSLAVRFPPT
jgi:hypothetical protein